MITKERTTTTTAKMTVGLDLGDKYTYLCVLDTQSGEVIEEGRLRTTPDAFARRFGSEKKPLRIAIEVGTHSPWVSRVLEEQGHEVLVANPRKTRLIHAGARKRTRSTPRSWLVWPAPTPSFFTRLRTEARLPRRTWL